MWTEKRKPKFASHLFIPSLSTNLKFMTVTDSILLGTQQKSRVIMLIVHLDQLLTKSTIQLSQLTISLKSVHIMIWLCASCVGNIEDNIRNILWNRHLGTDIPTDIAICFLQSSKNSPNLPFEELPNDEIFENQEQFYEIWEFFHLITSHCICL